MARRFTRPARSSVRRETEWFSFNVGIDSLISGTAVVLGSLNAAALAMRPFTIIRTHFEAYLISD